MVKGVAVNLRTIQEKIKSYMDAQAAQCVLQTQQETPASAPSAEGGVIRGFLAGLISELRHISETVSESTRQQAGAAAHSDDTSVPGVNAAAKVNSVAAAAVSQVLVDQSDLMRKELQSIHGRIAQAVEAAKARKTSSLSGGYISLLEEVLVDIQTYIQILSSAEDVKTMFRINNSDYLLARALGSVFIMQSQAVDPLLGAEVVAGAARLAGGMCMGLVTAWARGCIEQGSPNYPVTVNQEVQECQANPIDVFRKEISTVKTITSATADDLGDPINTLDIKLAFEGLEEDFPYCISICGGSVEQLSAHALAIRKRSNGTYEYYDPNVGTFFFKALPELVLWFEVHIQFYVIFMKFTHINFHKFNGKSQFQVEPFPPLEMFEREAVRIGLKARESALQKTIRRILSMLERDIGSPSGAAAATGMAPLQLQLLTRLFAAYGNFYASAKPTPWVLSAIDDEIKILECSLGVMEEETASRQGEDAGSKQEKGSEQEIPKESSYPNLAAHVALNFEVKTYLEKLLGDLRDARKRVDATISAMDVSATEAVIAKVLARVAEYRLKITEISAELISDQAETNPGGSQRAPILLALQRDVLSQKLEEARRKNIISRLTNYTAGITDAVFSVGDANAELEEYLPPLASDGFDVEAYIKGKTSDVSKLDKLINFERIIAELQAGQRKPLAGKVSVFQASQKTSRSAPASPFLEDADRQMHAFKIKRLEELRRDIDAMKMRLISTSSDKVGLTIVLPSFPEINETFIESLPALDDKTKAVDFNDLWCRILQFEISDRLPFYDRLHRILSSKEPGSLPYFVMEAFRYSVMYDPDNLDYYQDKKKLLLDRLSRVQEDVRVSVDPDNKDKMKTPAEIIKAIYDIFLVEGRELAPPVGEQVDMSALRQHIDLKFTPGKKAFFGAVEKTAAAPADAGQRFVAYFANGGVGTVFKRMADQLSEANREMLDAAAAGDTGKFDRALAQQGDVNVQGVLEQLGLTPIMLAISKGQSEFVCHMLSLTPPLPLNLSKTSNFKNNAVHLICEHELSLDATQAFFKWLAVDCDGVKLLTAENDTNLTPVEVALEHENFTAINAIVDHFGANCWYSDKLDQKLPPAFKAKLARRGFVGLLSTPAPAAAAAGGDSGSRTMAAGLGAAAAGGDSGSGGGYPAGFRPPSRR